MTPTDLRDAEHANLNSSASASSNERSAEEGAALADKAIANPSANDQAATFPGELLRAAREKSGLSIGDVATRLRMAVRQVEALEKADYTSLPSGTFLRGFVRNYAKVVHADPARAIFLLEQTHSSATVSKAATILVPNQDIKINIGPREMASPKARIAIAAGVLVLLACAAWYWWEFIRPNLAEGGRAKPAAETVSATTTPAASTTAPIDNSSLIMAPSAIDAAGKEAQTIQAIQASERIIENSKSEPVVQPTTAPNSSAGAGSKPATTVSAPLPSLKSVVPLAVNGTPIPAGISAASPQSVVTAPVAAMPAVTANATMPRTTGTSTLGFTFSGDSWIEVTDSTGKTILSRRYKAGDADEAAGRAPFSVVIGKAGVTRMAYNGKEFDLTPYTKLAVARVTVK